MSNYLQRSQFVYSYAARLTKVLPRISIGASGAPTLVSGTGMAVASVTRVSAGKYTIQLTNTYQSLLGIQMVINSGSSAPAAPLMYITADAVATAGTASVTIQLTDLTGAAADPASGEVLYLEIDLNNSSLGY